MNTFNKSRTAIFIMPRSSSSWEGAEALWITAAGWAAAAKKILGKAVVVTSDRIADPQEVWNYPLLPEKKRSGKNHFRYIPPFFRTVLSDFLTWTSLKNWRILNDLDVEADEVSFIWEKHDLFFGPGKSLSKKYNVPLISYVHAPVVWEASKWGVKRYLWGRILEKMESINLKKADLVAVVSEEVKQKVLEMGVQEKNILISPMAVDPKLFSSVGVVSENLRRKYNLEDKLVVGWTGSFRNFHGLDHVIKAFYEIQKKHSQVTLMLVGDGSERSMSEAIVERLGISDKVIFTGRKKFSEIPSYISVFDIAIVSARSAEGFHYSPLKLREYMAAGKAVLAPNAGEIPLIFKDQVHLKLFEPGNLNSLKTGMEFFILNKSKRLTTAQNGHNLVVDTSTWEVEVQKALKALGK